MGEELFKHELPNGIETPYRLKRRGTVRITFRLLHVSMSLQNDLRRAEYMVDANFCAAYYGRLTNILPRSAAGISEALACPCGVHLKACKLTFELPRSTQLDQSKAVQL